MLGRDPKEARYISSVLLLGLCFGVYAAGLYFNFTPIIILGITLTIIALIIHVYYWYIYIPEAYKDVKKDLKMVTRPYAVVKSRKVMLSMHLLSERKIYKKLSDRIRRIIVLLLCGIIGCLIFWIGFSLIIGRVPPPTLAFPIYVIIFFAVFLVPRLRLP